MQKADMVLHSDFIFDGINPEAFPGYIAIHDNKILAVTREKEDFETDESTQYIELGNQLVCPGFVDVHCFFTGYLLTWSGLDVSQYENEDMLCQALTAYHQSLTPDAIILARNTNDHFTGLSCEVLDQRFGTVPVILFMEGFESCYMNSAAMVQFQFTPDTCWSESYWRLLKYLLSDKEHSVPAFKDYLSMMNSKGITSIKEMGFDDYWGFTDYLSEVADQKELTARVHFMSQPVGAGLNLNYGRKMRDRFQEHHESFLQFSGYNQMTDGSISQLEGCMKQPYLNMDTCCQKEIDWDQLETDALAADREGFRFSLHAQGDGAIGKTVDIFDKCQKDADGKLTNRHAITDLECSDPDDLKRMGELGIVAEIYPQIMSLADRESKVAMINRTIGKERGRCYWNRRKMADSGVVISCGTDLPLLYDDIPESIYHAAGALFPEGGEPFNPQNALTTAEVLTAWSYGGQYNLGCEEKLGTLTAGKLADITVLDRNVLTLSPQDAREAVVTLTITDGTIVYCKK